MSLDGTIGRSEKKRFCPIASTSRVCHRSCADSSPVSTDRQRPPETVSGRNELATPTSATPPGGLALAARRHATSGRASRSKANEIAPRHRTSTPPAPPVRSALRQHLGACTTLGRRTKSRPDVPLLRSPAVQGKAERACGLGAAGIGPGRRLVSDAERMWWTCRRWAKQLRARRCASTSRERPRADSTAAANRAADRCVRLCSARGCDERCRATPGS